MTELDKIKNLEDYFPKIFTDMEEHDFGLIFYNADNYDSHDSNHAVILNSDNYGETVKYIKEFYLSKNLSPRIYSAFKDGQLDDLRAILESNGFTAEDYGQTDFLVRNGKSNITEPFTLDFRRFTENDDLSVCAQIFDSDTTVRTQKVVERRVLCPDYHLYIGYADEIPAVMASMQFDENMTARLDEVETAEKFRGRGYARQMTRHLTNLFERSGGKLFFTWAANDTAQRVYLQGGFDVKYKLPSWSAYIEVQK